MKTFYITTLILIVSACMALSFFLWKSEVLNTELNNNIELLTLENQILKQDNEITLQENAVLSVKVDSLKREIKKVTASVDTVYLSLSDSIESIEGADEYLIYQTLYDKYPDIDSAYYAFSGNQIKNMYKDIITKEFQDSVVIKLNSKINLLQNVIDVREDQILNLELVIHRTNEMLLNKDKEIIILQDKLNLEKKNKRLIFAGAGVLILGAIIL